MSEYKTIVRRSKRKTTSIYIERDGSVTVLAPDRLTNNDIREILKANEYKIYKYQAKRKLLNEKAIKREPVNGQAYLYLGRNYYLQYSNSVEDIEFKGRYFYAPDGSSNKLKQMFKVFYRNRGKKYISSRAGKYAEAMGLKIDEISVMDLKTRWASCSAKKLKINFNWKVMMAPASVINYLIVHELTHFNHKRHNMAFWNAIDKIIPNYQKQITWLKEYGASLEI
jgi:predicted metal-dependent hydrolase